VPLPIGAACVFLWERIDAVKQLAAVSADGCPVSAYDEGDGQAAVIIVGGAGDNGRGHARLAAKLTSTNRVLRLIRRQYRTDLAAWRPVNVTDEVADVVALARTADRPCYLFGHSSGGVIALEAALIAPESFAALAVFEPPVELGETPLPPAATHAARQAIDAGRPGRAIEIFARDLVKVPRPAARLARLLALSPRFRNELIPGMVSDQEALDRLGGRLAAYGTIRQHVLLVTGAKSPEHLRRGTEQLHSVLPFSDIFRMDSAGHAGPITSTRDLAQLLAADIEAHTAG
jgi:pimeloyl-ACP methyl ester carboxylesterase